MTDRRVLVIGGTGMLGRPVVRRMVSEGLAVRCLVRDPLRARTLLPADCQLIRGDVRDDARLLDALDGCEWVYINLSEPMTRSRPAWDPEVEGTKSIIAACRASGVRRVVRISAMGVDDAAAEPDAWWAAVSKREADRALAESDLDWTIFRPTWFMESLCTFRVFGPWMLCPDLGRSPLRWIAGDDYARQVIAALLSDEVIGRIENPQGPEPLTIAQALRRLRNSWTKRRLRLLHMPMWMMRPGAAINGKADYFNSLLRMTRDHFARIDREAITTSLPQAKMTIEDFARYVERTGDWPRK